MSANRARALFIELVAQVPPEQWDRCLAELAGDDQELHAKVALLLAAHRQADSFLEQPAAPLGGTVVESPASVSPSEPPPQAGGTEQPSLVLAGRYKLVEPIGEGGMGTVWMAQQTEPVKRLVAVKLIKPGMDSKQVLARFEAERQALALMDHPHIAKVHDAGVAPDGRPFFVMELVKGVLITRYCDEQRLTPRQRLELFVPVCQAVQHAHQKGIIHRDLKPSNVLVALYDDKPVPKVIDFGVAKATGQPLTERTLQTGFGAIVGTIEYMSPEQANFNQLDVDTRSDIYALGVLLYELLAGSPPFGRKELEKAGLLEMLRVIREQEPSKPSTKLSTADGLPSLAANRGTEPKRLAALVRGELDWIVMKALEKDRNRRYETANAFSADVQRYLADEPVQACPPSASYRLRKFVRRNRGRLVVAAILGAALLVAVGGIGWGLLDRAARQAKVANDLELNLDRADLFQGKGEWAEALKAFDRAQLLAGQASSDPVRDERLDALKERLDAEARDREFIAKFEDIQLRVQSRVHVEENRFARAEGVAFPEIRDALRQYGIAIGTMTPALAAARIQGRQEPVHRALVAALDECLLAPKGDSQTRQWLLAALAAADRDAWRERARKAGAGRDWNTLEQLAREAEVLKQPPSFLLRVAYTLPAEMRSTRLGLLRRTQRAYPADLWANLELASELQENGQPAEAIRYYTAAVALRPDNPGIHLNRGNALREAGEVDAAIADYRQSLALAPRYAETHNSLGIALRAKGRMDKAIDEYREAIRIKKDYAEAHTNLGAALQAKGQLDEAIAEYQEAIRIKKHCVEAHYGLGLALYDKGQLDEAIAEYHEAIGIKKDYTEAHTGLALALFHKGQVDEAIAAYQEAIRIKKDNAEAHYGLGIALRAKGQLDEAIAEYRKAIGIKKHFAQAHYSLGIALRAKGRLDEAIAEYQEALRIRKDYAEAHYNLGNALYFKGRLDEAIAAYRQALRIKKDYAEAHYNLGQALRQQGEFRQALEELRRGHELGSKNPRWRDPSGQSVRECERLIELDGQLPGFLEGKITPASPAERIELAGLCSLKRLHRAAARFYEEAFAAEPKLADDPHTENRYHAACAAALAGCGQGKAAADLDAAERTRLRRQALDWLRADLAAWRRLLDKEPDKARPLIVQKMQHWLADTDFAGVRGPEALAKLPEAERQSWQKLWGDIADTLARGQRKTTPEKKSDVK